jgi:hypothetical protein
VSRARFSKASVAAEIEARIRALREEWPSVGLDPDKGWAQVAGKGEGANRVYGEFQALCDLAERLGLDVDVTAGWER